MPKNIQVDNNGSKDTCVPKALEIVILRPNHENPILAIIYRNMAG